MDAAWIGRVPESQLKIQELFPWMLLAAVVVRPGAGLEETFI